jgi:hypothetical protein
MLVTMAMVGNGVFASRLGAIAPDMTLIMHVVFGDVVGLVYGWISA